MHRGPVVSCFGPARTRKEPMKSNRRGFFLQAAGIPIAAKAANTKPKPTTWQTKEYVMAGQVLCYVEGKLKWQPIDPDNIRNAI